MASDRIPFIELIVRVSDGSFESRLTVPVSAPKEQHASFARMWIDALGQAVKLTCTEGKDGE